MVRVMQYLFLVACASALVGCDTPAQVEEKVRIAFIEGQRLGEQEGFVRGKEAGQNEVLANIATVAASTINESIRWVVGGFAVLALLLILTVWSMLKSARPTSPQDFALQRDLLLREVQKELALFAAQHAALSHRR